MSSSIGGAIISKLTLTYSWGLTPASAEIEAVGGGVLQPETPIVLNIGSLIFYGIVANCKESTSGLRGTSLTVSVIDNRIKLMQDLVFCKFNEVVVIEADPSLPGINRLKRYRHIYPDDWPAQKQTITDFPIPAQAIMQMLFAASTVNYAWAANYDANFSQPAYGIDANKGKKLGSVIQEICEQLGTMMTLVGPTLLQFAEKGTGAVPAPSIGYNAEEYSDGLALGPETKVAIVGDRNLYQDLPINLVPGWNRLYEAFWFQGAWLAEVTRVFSIAAGPERVARSLEITLREYCAKLGYLQNSGNPYVDMGKWGEVCRMEIPVWTYINDIVYKAYAVPTTYTINGIDLASLELQDGLLCEVEGSIDGTLSYRNDGYYTDTKAYCLVQGHCLSNFDPKFLDTLNVTSLAAHRTAWQPMNRFNLDTKNNCVIFEEPVFVDGSGTDALMIAINKPVKDAGADLQRVMVPNANVKISPASVRASLCFAAEIYSKSFGSGNRSEVKYVSGLGFHVLLQQNTWSSEVTYASGMGADQIATDAGNAALTGQNFLQSGGFTRVGSAGTALTGSIDRVTATMQFMDGGEGDGIKEHIEYAKERAPIHFESERELERRPKIGEAARNIRELHRQAENIRFAAKYLKPAKRQTQRPYQTIQQIMEMPPGSPNPGTRTFVDANQWLAGQPVFGDTTGNATQDGTIFMGIVTAQMATGQAIPMATQGIVPVLVTGPFNSGDTIGIDPGPGQTAYVGGAKMLGIANASYTGSSKVVAPVRLGTAFNSMIDFSLYVAGKDGSGNPKLGIRDGVVNGVLPAGMSPGGYPAYVITPSPGDTVAWLEQDVTLDASGVIVSSTLSINTGNAMPSDSAAQISDSGSYFKGLGTFSIAAGVLKIGSGLQGIGSQRFSLCLQPYQSPVSFSGRWQA